MTRSDWKIIVLVAVLLTLSFPPFPLGFLAPIALAVLLNYILHLPVNRGFAIGYWSAVLWGFLTLYWIANNTLPGMLLTVFIGALHYGLVWWLVRRVHEYFPRLALWIFPVVWVAAEFFRQFTDLRFNWLNLAYTQTYYLPYIQLAEITGYLGVSFLLAVLGVLLYCIVRFPHRRFGSVGVMLALIILPSLYGWWRIQALEATKIARVKVAVVQPNVDPYQKWEPAFQEQAFAILDSLTLQAVGDSPRVVIWPETATPFFLRNEPRYLKRIHQIVDSFEICLLTGTPDYQYHTEAREYHTYNAAFFFRPHFEPFQFYYKMALVPAAESMPFKQIFPFLRKINVGGGDFFPGREFKVFRCAASNETNNSYTHPSGKVRLSVAICYESVFPQIVRGFVQNGANILAVITNDGWFGTTSGPYQHQQYAVFRAIEHRISVARSANTGISVFIAPTGKIIGRLPLNSQGVLSGWLPIREQPTLYTRWGDWLGWLAVIISILVLTPAHFLKQKWGKAHP